MSQWISFTSLMTSMRRHSRTRSRHTPTGSSYTHCVLWKWETLEDYASAWREFAASVTDDTPVAAAPGADHWWGCKVVELDDPELVKYGPDEWSRRDVQSVIDSAKSDARVAKWMTDRAWWTLDQGDLPHRASESWLRELSGQPFKE